MRQVTIICTVVFMLLAISVKGCTQHKDFLVENAAEVWQHQGFKVVAYEGWQLGLGIGFTKYGSASVWHRLQKVPDNGITYSGYSRRWGDEVHVYGPTATEAISPR